MRVRLERRDGDDATVTLAARATLPEGPLRLCYRTRTGALLRVDGAVRGAFDGKHEAIDLPPLEGERELSLRVERRSLPISALPAGDGVRWRWMLARAEQTPDDHLEVEQRNGASDGAAVDVPLIGHAHLDVAWLWTYDETKRKALRTFATALREMELDDRYVFAQSMPQLYAWVRAGDPALFERVRERAASARGWDASVASMWVESDLHAPSGESILRQFALGIAWTREHLGRDPSVAWLPDTFGFPSTFPTLAVHAGIPYFFSTKLAWNEATRWPHPQFRWTGDDGSTLLAAMALSYGGDITAERETQARARNEPLIHGYGDGGGGATDEQLASVARASRPWTHADTWFAALDARALPEVRGELYLETHRGTYTTHHDVKERNAALERELAHAEELAAWCVAVRAPRTVRRALADDLRAAWEIVLRAQFHDVITGTAIPPVYADVAEEHARAAAIVARVRESAASLLPRSDVRAAAAAAVRPQRDGETWLLRNEYVQARLRDDGTVVELAGADGVNVVALANGLAAYEDKPKRYDAWNVDDGYWRKQVPVKPDGGSADESGIEARFALPKSKLAMRIALHEDEPWLRVEIAAAWHDHRVLLRAEHRVAVAARDVRYGQPHGTLVRNAYPQTDAERAKFEVPAQRWAHASDGAHGLAVFSPDCYGWNGTGLDGGGVRLGTSLLRSPRWPDPGADRGEQRIAYALVPTAGAAISALEHAWLAYVEDARVRLFTCDDPAVVVVATYPSRDGEAVVVRVRELDGAARAVALRCGGRMRTATAIDAAERPLPNAGESRIVEEALHFELGAFALRSFLIAF